jgi:RNA polymerase sigma-70 factor (ECF subfamily)
MERLLKTANRITKSREEAEEAVQDTFLKVYRHVGGFRGECKLSTWLITITRNHALMIVRKKRHPVLSIDAASGDEGRNIATTLIATGSSPEDICIDQQRWERLLLSIERLPNPRRDIFELHFRRDMRVTEIAQLRGLSVSAVKAQLHRTTQGLREADSGYIQQKRVKRNQRTIRRSRPSVLRPTLEIAGPITERRPDC